MASQPQPPPPPPLKKPLGPGDPCPSCGAALEEEAAFCEACGYHVGGAGTSPVPGAGPRAGASSSPLMIVFALFWFVLAVAGLLWLFARAWVLE